MAGLRFCSILFTFVVLLIPDCARSETNRSRIGTRHECASVRGRKNRVLFIVTTHVSDVVSATNAMTGTGWQVGLLISKHICPMLHDAGCQSITPWHKNPPKGVGFFDDRSAITTEAIAEAINAFGPSLVMPYLSADIATIIRAAKSLTASRTHAAARHVLLCSLPPNPAHWPAMSTKSAAMDLLRSVGVPTPWRVRVCPPLSIATRERIRREAVQKLPVIFKTDRDGAGHGLSACKPTQHECVTKKMSALAATIAHAGGKACYSIEQFVEGITVLGNSPAIDGAVVSTVSIVKALTSDAKGVTAGAVTFNDPRMLQYAEAVAARMRFVGFMSFDYRLSPAGELFAIDANFRYSYMTTVMGHAVGIVPHALYRMRRALLSSAQGERTQYRAALLNHSITVGKLTSGKVPDLFLCSDTYLQWPWGLVQHSDSIVQEWKGLGIHLDLKSSARIAMGSA